MPARQKVMLSHNVTLRLRNVVMNDYRSDNILRAPGLDLLAPSPPDTVGAAVVVDTSPSIVAYCYPTAEWRQDFQAVVRPAMFPGRQVYQISLNQSTCINSTAALLRNRCWADVTLILDMAMNGEDVDMTGKPAANHYAVRLLTMPIMCRNVLTAECLNSLGPIGCMLLSQRNSSSLPKIFEWLQPSQPPRLASPPPPPSPVFLEPADSGDDGDGVPLVPVLVGSIVGGVAFIVLVVLGFVLWHRRSGANLKTRDSDGLPGDVCKAPGPGSDPEPGSAQTTQEKGSGRGSAAHSGKGSAPSSARGSAPNSGRGTSDVGERVRQLAAQISSLTQGSARSGIRSLWPVNSPSGAQQVVTLQTPLRADVTVDVKLEEGLVEGGEEGKAVATADVDKAGVVQLLPNVLGKGAFGRVQEGIFGGQRVAVKQILDSMYDTGSSSADASAQSFMQELEVLARCQHPNIVKVLAASLKPPKPCMVLELMQTSLDKLLYGDGDRLLPLDLALYIGIEIAHGLEYLHPTVIHRDLKPANVLINDPWGEHPVVKLSDFGLSRLRHTMLVTKNPEAGTPAYVAPECFDTDAEVGAISHKADLYSFGVVLWELVAGTRPWKGMGPVPIAMQITMLHKRLPMPPRDAPGSDPMRWPPKLVKLIEECWDKDPQRRPAAAEVARLLAVLRESLQIESQSGSLRNPDDSRVLTVSGSTSTVAAQGLNSHPDARAGGSSGLPHKLLELSNA
ncbi:hypothetical protein HYH03_013066 [Edaphochlamys debaryana]|uniref:Protein kinase domain-containing protein n=1 Tax=Edaphochlamys debaryana TaxID=47281 RepID=A0A835XRP3_9CHLO|nr:hypothetical protein HYH03_013066 [Edaphochlamys debaryana]|eukprot:KAG2488377.1 hypothetical protein HYH03_013066 [Edaphochlamys debaryana]